MPKLTPEVEYTGLMPYHQEFDNLPLRNIVANQQIINTFTEQNRQELNNAQADAGSIANRLDQSLDTTGNLKVSAIDEVLHSIEAHSDTDTYVRMEAVERARLSLIEDEANFLSIIFDDAGPSQTPVPFDTGDVTVANSSSVTWRFQNGKIFADLAFSTSSAHRHFYDITPTMVSGFQSYSLPVNEFMAGTLRIYINGSRLSESDSIWIPGFMPADAFVVLDSAITSSDVIKVDFDISLV
jgi:hypothetical protein